MSCYIRVTNPDETASWERLGYTEDYNKVKDILEGENQITNEYGLLFGRDFLAMNSKSSEAEKIENTVLQTLAYIASYILDFVASAACYVITYITGSREENLDIPKESLPLYKLLSSQNAQKELLDSDKVDVRAVLLSGSLRQDPTHGELIDCQLKGISKRMYFSSPSNDTSVNRFFEEYTNSSVNSVKEILVNMGIINPKVVSHLTPKA